MVKKLVLNLPRFFTHGIESRNSQFIPFLSAVHFNHVQFSRHILAFSNYAPPKWYSDGIIRAKMYKYGTMHKPSKTNVPKDGSFQWFHRSFLSLFLFRHGLKSELEKISQKFNFLLKGAVSEQFLNERPARNIMNKFKNGWFQKFNFSSRGPPLCTDICKIHLNVQVIRGNEMVSGKVYNYFLKPRNRFLFNKFLHICLIKKFYFIKRGHFFSAKSKNSVFFKTKHDIYTKF